ncbi:MAG: DUF3089 domain-containing protein [Acidobacteriota bacterium]
MKRWLAIASLLVVAVLLAGFLFRDAIGFFALRLAISPKQDFNEMPTPAAPDYADDGAWGALPALDDPTDPTPPGLESGEDTAEVDVFFLQPTTYLSPASWNQPLDDADTNDLTDSLVLRGQASAFNGCCRIFAPRYRQATFFSFLDESGNGDQALDLAFSDVEAAFDSFLERIGDRPFILAGHSQGSLHTERLLRERVSGTPLLKRLVAAYPMGYWFNEEELSRELPDVPVCGTANQTGCLVTWNSVGPRVRHFEDPAGNVCVNPLSWSTDGARVAHESNAGSLNFSGDGMQLEGAVADAQCVDGALIVQEIRSDAYAEMPPIMGRDNFHILDVHLFYRSVHENARRRTSAYLAARAEATSAIEAPEAATLD